MHHHVVGETQEILKNMKHEVENTTETFLVLAGIVAIINESELRLSRRIDSFGCCHLESTCAFRAAFLESFTYGMKKAHSC